MDIDPDELDPDAIDLGDLDCYAAGRRDHVFATLRKWRPISFHEEPNATGVVEGPGFWALTRYDDVVYASRDPQTFISGRGSNIPDHQPDGALSNLDDPLHAEMRRAIFPFFTRRRATELDEVIRASVRSLLASVAARGTAEFVSDLAAPIPLHVMCDIIGIPQERRAEILRLTTAIHGNNDPAYGGDGGLAAAWDLATIIEECARYRRLYPADDVLTVLSVGEFGGRRLTPFEIASFLVMLVAAGNETTRTTITHAVYLLSGRPDLQAQWHADRGDARSTSMEELLRWSSPILYQRRTANRDLELRGTHICAGDKVVLWYTSANRDEAKFSRPFDVDLRRAPNEHVAFGAPGPHFCLGSHLARRETRIVVDEILSTFPEIEVVGEPELLRSSFLNGIKRMDVAFEPRAVSGVR